MISKKSLSSLCSRHVTLMLRLVSRSTADRTFSRTHIRAVAVGKEVVTKSVVATPNLETNEDKISLVETKNIVDG